TMAASSPSVSVDSSRRGKTSSAFSAQREAATIRTSMASPALMLLIGIAVSSVEFDQFDAPSPHQRCLARAVGEYSCVEALGLVRIGAPGLKQVTLMGQVIGDALLAVLAV